MRKVIDQSNYVFEMPEALDTEDIVDRDGYRSVDMMVSEFIEAGESLERFRKEMSVYEGMSDDEILEDRFVNKNYDEIDAIKDSVIANENINKARAEDKKKEEEKKKEDEELIEIGRKAKEEVKVETEVKV